MLDVICAGWYADRFSVFLNTSTSTTLSFATSPVEFTTSINGSRQMTTGDVNSDGKTVYTRYVGEQHIKEDCYNYIPTAKDWIDALQAEKKPMWMIRTLDLKVDDLYLLL